MDVYEMLFGTVLNHAFPSIDPFITTISFLATVKIMTRTMVLKIVVCSVVGPVVSTIFFSSLD